MRETLEKQGHSQEKVDRLIDEATLILNDEYLTKYDELMAKYVDSLETGSEAEQEAIIREVKQFYIEHNLKVNAAENGDLSIAEQMELEEILDEEATQLIALQKEIYLMSRDMSDEELQDYINDLLLQIDEL